MDELEVIEGASFGDALSHLKVGRSISRAGWNGKGMYLWLVPGVPELETGELERLPYIAMKTTDDKVVPWLASQTDVLAEDWVVS